MLCLTIYNIYIYNYSGTIFLLFFFSIFVTKYVFELNMNSNLHKAMTDGLLTNPLNAELNPICHLLALLGAHHILHVSGIRVKTS